MELGLWEAIGFLWNLGLVIGLFFLIKSAIPHDAAADFRSIWSQAK